MRINSSVKDLLIVFILFMITIGIRLPNLNRPVSKHHEFNTAFFLIPMEIWNEEGVVRHGCIPPYNYSNENDKYIIDPIGIEHGNKNGTYYYLSFPAFSYLAPYAFIQLFQLPVSPLSLQVFNLLLHFLLCIMLFRLLSTTVSRAGACVGVVFYLFSPATLWFHGNGYTHHVLSQLLIVAVIYFFLGYIRQQRRILLFCFSVTLFFLFLTEWIGLFLAATIFFIALVKRKEGSAYRMSIRALFITGILAASVLLFQYACFFGWKEYTGYLWNRFSHRSTLVNHSFGIVEQIGAWMKWNLVSYGTWMLLLLGLFLIAMRKKGIAGYRYWESSRKQLFLLLLCPVVAYHVVFMEFTSSHDYSVLIDGLLWSFCLAVLSSETDGYVRYRNILTALSCVAVFLSVAQYYMINRPGKYNQNGDPYTIYMDIGETVRKTALPDETVFMMGFDTLSVNKNNPQIMYYAKRSIKSVDSKEEAYDFMRKFGREKGRLYILKNKQVAFIEELVPGESE